MDEQQEHGSDGIGDEELDWVGKGGGKGGKGKGKGPKGGCWNCGGSHFQSNAPRAKARPRREEDLRMGAGSAEAPTMLKIARRKVKEKEAAARRISIRTLGFRRVAEVEKVDGEDSGAGRAKAPTGWTRTSRRK